MACLERTQEAEEPNGAAGQTDFGTEAYHGRRKRDDWLGGEEGKHGVEGDGKSEDDGIGDENLAKCFGTAKQTLETR